MPGYCMHAAVPFPTWHRPYVVFFLKPVAAVSMGRILRGTNPANFMSYSSKCFLASADYCSDIFPQPALDYIATLRVPYWDWAATPAVPDVVTTHSITIHTPEGFQGIDHPLHNSTFQTDVSGNGVPSGDPVRLCSIMKPETFVQPSSSID